MQTKILDCTKENIRLAAEIIKRGGLVAFPTETVYGLGANAMDECACKKVYSAKGRPSDNPMICHIADTEDIAKLTDNPDARVKKLMKLFCPGPITLIVSKKKEVPLVTSGGLETIGVRLPDNEIARSLIRFSGVPIAAPSANISGKPSPTTYKHVVDDMNNKIDVILKGQDCRVGIESTVVDTTGKELVVLRPGMITAREISRKIGEPVLYDSSLNKKPTDENFVPKAPGMKYKHYAPKAEMKIFEGSQAKVKEAVEKAELDARSQGIKVDVILFDAEEYDVAAHDFFAELRRMDKENVELILCGALKMSDDAGFAVMNRMLKSAGYNIQKV